MMRLVFILLLLGSLATDKISAQDYFSEFIPFGPYSPNPLELNVYNGEYLITALSFLDSGNPSTNLLYVDDEFQVRRYDFENINANYECTQVENGVQVAATVYRGDTTLIDFLRHEEGAGEESHTYAHVSSGKARVFDAITLHDDFYIGSADRINPDQTSPDYRWEATIHKFGLDGTELWQRNYGQEGNYNAISYMFPSADNHLMVSLVHNKSGGNFRSAWLMKLDDEGDVIWRYESQEKPTSGADVIHAVQLSDGTYVISHTLDKSTDPAYFGTDLSRFPIRFRWINDNGFSIKERTKDLIGPDRLIQRGLLAGKGEYFFSYGMYQFNGPLLADTAYAQIVKYDNNGDTIWTKLYHHPDYTEPGTSMIVNDIVEHDNGDITCLVNIDLREEINKIWLFKVGPSGCPNGAADCDELIVVPNTVTSTVETVSDGEVLVYPNPHESSFTVTHSEHVEYLRLYDNTGGLLLGLQTTGSETEISTVDFPQGKYLLTCELHGGKITSQQIIKQ